MEILGIGGFVFAATAAGVLVYEHEIDVLHGPYIEGSVEARVLAAIIDTAEAFVAPARAVVEPLIEQLNWRARGAIYLASLA